MSPIEQDRRTASAAQAAPVRSRKAEHLELALDEGAEGRDGAGWSDVELAHVSLPEIDLDDVDLTTTLLDADLRAPLVVAGMTGGHPLSEQLNARLGAAAHRHGLAVGVGSQRAALLDPSLESTYTAVRRSAPDAYVIANIGAAQLVPQRDHEALELTDVNRLIAMVDANALAVHLNFLEEVIQPEGDRRARGCSAAIARVCDALAVPVIAKETGGGMTPETAVHLQDLGVAALDVGGAGGTSFASIERIRAERHGDSRGSGLGATFARWGVPTAAAVAAAAGTALPVIATGGIRSGLDAAKALALGATAVGVARPLLQAATGGDDELDSWIERFLSELRAAMFLTGCRRPRDLRDHRVLIDGRTRVWIEEFECSRRTAPR